MKYLLEKWGPVPIGELDCVAVASWLSGREGWCGRTKNNVRQAIGLMFGFARQQKWVGRDHEGVTAIPEFSERGSGAIGVLKAGVAYE